MRIDLLYHMHGRGREGEGELKRLKLRSGLIYEMHACML